MNSTANLENTTSSKENEYKGQFEAKVSQYMEKQPCDCHEVFILYYRVYF